MQNFWRRRQLLTWAVMSVGAALLAGCGGGGGGGGGSSSNPTTVTITGALKDSTTAAALPTRTVTVQGTGLSGISDTNGAFSIAGVTVGTVTLVITDSAGVTDGTFSVNLGSLSGNPRSVGTISLAVSGTGGGPPAPPGG